VTGRRGRPRRDLLPLADAVLGEIALDPDVSGSELARRLHCRKHVACRLRKAVLAVREAGCGPEGCLRAFRAQEAVPIFGEGER
jgi:hypothetical protein